MSGGQVGRYSEAGTQGGMVFTDPVFSKGVETGKLTRWAIDRFTTVLMGGIAAEAIHYGSCEVTFNRVSTLYLRFEMFNTQKAIPKRQYS